MVPLGATEQHGPQLPLGTDTIIAVALASSLEDAVIAPALPYGSSGEHDGFPGTLSIGQAALSHVLVELVRSSDFARVLFVSAHGGNAEPLAAAVRELRDEGQRSVGVVTSVEGRCARRSNRDLADARARPRSRRSRP